MICDEEGEDETDFDLIMSMPDIEKHKGKWVAVVDHKIVAIEDTLEDALYEAIVKHPGSVPYIAKIPEGHMLLL